MGRLVVSENMSLDGVVQDPSGDEGFGRGGWVGRIGDVGREDAATILLGEARAATALVLGRRTYEFFAQRWPPRTGPLADRLNTMRKYVVSSTLTDPAWNNTTILNGDVSGEIAQLKARLGGDIVVYGSLQLVSALMGHDLVDEFRLMMYPVVLGTGQRLFGETREAKPMRLIHAEAVGQDLVLIRYEAPTEA